MIQPPASGITGIHHLTAVSSDTRRSLDFYTDVLGLFPAGQPSDGDATADRISLAAAPDGSALLTFLDLPGAPRGHYGVGGTHHLAFETRDHDTLRQWKRWLMDRGLTVTGPYSRVYFESIYFTDPDGLILEIATRGPGWTLDEAPDALGFEVKLPPPDTIVGGRDEAAIAADTWPDPVPALTPEMRLERIHHITAIGSDAKETERFFTGLLGMRLVKRTVNFDNPTSPHLYFGVGAGDPGTIITYFAYPRGTMRPVRPGFGLTHHFALSVADDVALLAWRDHVTERGVAATAITDHGDSRGFAIHDPDDHLIAIATTPRIRAGARRGEPDTRG